MQDLIQSLIGWLPDAVEPYAEVLIYLGLLGLLSLVPLILWLAWAAAPRKRRSS
jgi:hypothetical protein